MCLRRSSYKIITVLTVVLSFYVSQNSSSESLIDPNQKEEYLCSLEANHIPFIDLVQIIKYKNTVYVNVLELLDILDFKAVLQGQKIAGWLHNSKETYVIDFENQIITLPHKKIAINNEEFLYENGIFFLREDVLSEIIKCSFDLNHATSKISMLSDKPLPIEQRIIEENRRNKLKEKEKPPPSTIESNYENYSTPIVGFELKSAFNKIGNTTSTPFSYGMTIDNNTLSHHNHFSMSATENKINSATITLTKIDRNSEMLGPLKAARYEIGDTSSFQNKLTSSGSVGKGIRLTNNTQNHREFDTININGLIDNNWSVELYRNDVLLDYLPPITGGTYEFQEVQLLYGKNTIKLIFYGPGNEIKEEVREYNIGNTMLKGGKALYSISVTEKNKKVFDSILYDAPKKDETGLEAVTNMSYGFNNSLTGRVSVQTSPIFRNGQLTKNNQFYSLGLSTNYIPKTLISTTLAMDPNKNMAQLYEVTGNYFGTNVKLDQFFFDKFNSEKYNSPTDYKYITDLSVSRTIPLLQSAKVFTSLRFLREKKIGLTQDTYENRLSSNIPKVGHISNTVEYIRSKGPGSNAVTINDTLRLNRNFFFRSSIRGEATYSKTYNSSRLTNFGLTINKTLDKEKSLALSATRTLSTKIDTYKASLTIKKPQFNIILESSMSSDKNYHIGAGLRFYVFKEPHANKLIFSSKDVVHTGAGVVKYYYDKNGNNTYDEDEDIIEPINTEEENNKNSHNGSMFIDSVDINNGSMIKSQTHLIHEVNGEEVALTPSDSDYKINAVPGKINSFLIPVHPTTDIEGYLNLNKGGEVNPMSNVKINLYDKNKDKIIKSSKSEHDGYFLLERIKEGNYELLIDKDFLESNNLKQKSAPLEIDSEKIKEMAQFKDIICLEKEVTHKSKKSKPVEESITVEEEYKELEEEYRESEEEYRELGEEYRELEEEYKQAQEEYKQVKQESEPGEEEYKQVRQESEPGKEGFTEIPCQNEDQTEEISDFIKALCKDRKEEIELNNLSQLIENLLNQD